MELFNSTIHQKILDEKIIATTNNVAISKKLLIFQIGDNPTSEKYVAIKSKTAQRLGLQVEFIKLSETIVDEELHNNFKDLCADDVYSGIIVQLPLPRKSLNGILDLIPQAKDIDILSTKDRGALKNGTSLYLPPTLRATLYFCETVGLNIESLKVFLVGRGFLIGQPIEDYLSMKVASVVVTENYKNEFINADLVVLGAGVPKLVKGENLKDGCCVIDFGSNVVDGKIVGDLDMTSKLDHLGAISTSPGGLGPIVVRFLFINFLESLKLN